MRCEASLNLCVDADVDESLLMSDIKNELR